MNLTQRIQAKIRSLGYDFRHYTLESFIKHVEEYTGRRILLSYLEMASKETGAWIKDGEEAWEYIFIASNASSFIQQQSIFHEVGHLLLDHGTYVITRAELPYLVEKFHSIRFRNLRKDKEEREAETFALFVQKELLQHARYSDLSGIENFADAVGMI